MNREYENYPDSSNLIRASHASKIMYDGSNWVTSGDIVYSMLFRIDSISFCGTHGVNMGLAMDYPWNGKGPEPEYLALRLGKEDSVKFTLRYVGWKFAPRIMTGKSLKIRWAKEITQVPRTTNDSTVYSQQISFKKRKCHKWLFIQAGDGYGIVLNSEGCRQLECHQKEIHLEKETHIRDH